MNIEQILNFLEKKQVELEKLGEPEEIAFQLAVAYLSTDEIELWHQYNFENRQSR